MLNRPFDNYKNIYQKKNPNANLLRCWKSFQTRIIQQGGYNIGFNLFKKSINSGGDSDIDSWKHYENILLQGGGPGPCSKIGSPVLFNDNDTLYFSILIDNNNKKCKLLKYNIAYKVNADKLLNDNNQWSWPLETTCDKVLVIPGTKVYDANGTQIKINLDKISYLKDNLNQRFYQDGYLVKPSVKTDLHAYFIDNQNQSTILKQLSRPEILKYLCQENTCFKKQKHNEKNILSKVNCSVTNPEQENPSGIEPLKLPQIDNTTDSIKSQSQDSLSLEQNPLDNQKPMSGNIKDTLLNPLQTNLKVNVDKHIIRNQSKSKKDKEQDPQNIDSYTKDISSDINHNINKDLKLESEQFRKQENNNFKPISINQYKDYGDQSCVSKKEEECIVCNELKGKDLTSYQKELTPSGDKKFQILDQVKKTPYRKTTLYQDKLKIQPNNRGTPIFCYTDQYKIKHFKRLYPKRIFVEQTDWTSIPSKAYIPQDFTLGPKSISILDMSSSCCGIKNNLHYLSNDCLSDINSGVEPEEYNLRDVCPNFTKESHSRYGSIINYGEDSINKSGYNDPNIGRPLNPNGRTGLAGKGILAKWGPNYEALTMLVRKNTTREEENGITDDWDIKLEYNINNKSLTIPTSSISNNNDEETSLLVAQSEFLEHLIELEPDKLITIVDHNSAKGYNLENGISNRVNLMNNGDYTTLLKGADKIFSQSEALSEIYIAIEDMVRKGFSPKGGCVDLLYTGCISDNRNTDNAWVEGAVYLFNISAKPHLVEAKYWKWIQDIANTEKKSTGENSFSWFNLNDAGNGKPLEWEDEQLTCCEGDGLSFVALADGYLKGLDIEKAREREAIKKIEMENESDSQKIGEIINNIKQSYSEVANQRNILDKKEKDLTQYINELKSIGLDVISKEKGITFNKYIDLLNCNKDQGLRDQVICSDPRNSAKLINNNWINNEYLSKHSKLFSDDDISQYTTSQISAPLEPRLQSSVTGTVSESNGPSVTVPVSASNVPSVTRPVSVSNVPYVTESLDKGQVSQSQINIPDMTNPISNNIELQKPMSQTNTNDIKSVGGSLDDDVSSYMFTE